MLLRPFTKLNPCKVALAVSYIYIFQRSYQKSFTAGEKRVPGYVALVPGDGIGP